LRRVAVLGNIGSWLMARILFAWELGRNFGHASGLAPIAAELGRRGHVVIAALANIHEGQRFLPAEVLLLPIPKAPMLTKSQESKLGGGPPRTYGDLLTASGYHDARVLAALIRAWRSLLTLARPDVVLCESAPTAMLASRGLPFAKLGFGSGYSIPPRIAPWPPMVPRLSLPAVQLERRERALVRTINQALALNGIAPIAAPNDIFDLDATLVKSVPELDQYGARADVEYVGPSYTLDSGAAVAFPRGRGPRVFLYLRPVLAFVLEAVVQDLIRLPYRFIAVLPTASPEQLARLRLPHIRATTQPVRLDRVTRTADLAVCHSAVGTGTAFLFAGVPLLLVHTCLEQEMSARRAVDAGAALEARANEPTAYPGLMARLLQEPGFRANARRLAQRYGGEGEAGRVRIVCDRVERVLAERGLPPAAARRASRRARQAR
jgi:UDP:flavonoid glycosyltransferase YjiC (YdhE family)